MTTSTAARNYAGRPSSWNQDIDKIPESIDAGERHFSVSEIKKASDIAMFYLAASSCCPASPAIVNFEKCKSENKSFVSNSYWHRRVYPQGCGICNRIAANLAAFSSASGSRVAWVRDVCNLDKSVPVMPRRESGWKFSLTSE
jgi:hypothetical protein